METSVFDGPKVTGSSGKFGLAMVLLYFGCIFQWPTLSWIGLRSVPENMVEILAGVPWLTHLALLICNLATFSGAIIWMEAKDRRINHIALLSYTIAMVPTLAITAWYHLW